MRFHARRTPLILLALAALGRTLDKHLLQRRRAVQLHRVQAVKSARSPRASTLSPSLGDLCALPRIRGILSAPSSEASSFVADIGRAAGYAVLAYDLVPGLHSAEVQAWIADTEAHLAGLVRGLIPADEPADDRALLRLPTSLFTCSRCPSHEFLAFPSLAQHDCLNQLPTIDNIEDFVEGRRTIQACIVAAARRSRRLVPGLIKAIRPVQIESAERLVASTQRFFVDPAFRLTSTLADDKAGILRRLRSDAFAIGPFVRPRRCRPVLTDKAGSHCQH